MKKPGGVDHGWVAVSTSHNLLFYGIICLSPISSLTVVLPLILYNSIIFYCNIPNYLDDFQYLTKKIRFKVNLQGSSFLVVLDVKGIEKEETIMGEVGKCEIVECTAKNECSLGLLQEIAQVIDMVAKHEVPLRGGSFLLNCICYFPIKNIHNSQQMEQKASQNHQTLHIFLKHSFWKQNIFINLFGVLTMSEIICASQKIVSSRDYVD